MKKILFIFLLAGSVISAMAQTSSRTTTTTHRTYRYYYYPGPNVYFDESSGNYWYWDNGTSKWSMVQTLPPAVTLVPTQRYPVNYTGDDPWKNNAGDIKKYKIKKNGKVKIKPRKKEVDDEW